MARRQNHDPPEYSASGRFAYKLSLRFESVA
jgi:hypothetical protein